MSMYNTCRSWVFTVGRRVEFDWCSGTCFVRDLLYPMGFKTAVRLSVY